MYHRILVALDGSDEAESVFPHVSELARRFEASVVLLRATTHDHQLVRETVTAQATDLGLDVARRRGEAEAESARRYLDSARARLLGLGEVPVEVRVVQGPPAAAILEAARAAPDSTLVAMTTHGRGGLRRMAFGSVVDQVAQELRGKPLLLFRPAKT